MVKTMTKSSIDIELLLKNLNDQQKEAVLHEEGPCLVIAGAGSGKTSVVTRRIARLVGENKVAERNILAITFTNKAANEMKERIVALIGKRAKNIWISTFHAACVRILRQHATLLGYQPNFTIYNQNDSAKLLRFALSSVSGAFKFVNYKEASNAISMAKNELIIEKLFIGSNNRTECIIREVKDVYQALLYKANAMDFDDLLYLTIKLFDEHPDICNYYQRRFEQIFVDEFQDTNVAQNEFIKLISGYHNNVFVSGDEDQAIYGFRGSDYRNIMTFEKNYPNTKVIFLEQNYRSTSAILDVANSIISKNVARREKVLWGKNGKGTTVTSVVTQNEAEEAEWIARQILELDETSKKTTAILWRTNSQINSIEKALRDYSIPYDVISGVSFYERREIQDILAYLRLLINPEDLIAFRRIINVPRRGIGDSSLKAFESWAGEASLSLSQALEQSEGAGLTPKATGAFKAFNESLGKIRYLIEIGSLPKDILEHVLDEFKYRDIYIPEIEDAERLRNIDDLIVQVSAHESLDRFLESVALVSAQDSLDDEKTNKVIVATIHAVKGLEFSTVFIPGFEEGILPHFLALQDDGGIEEERRLAYVGVTRAKERLYLLRAEKRIVAGRYCNNPPSRFMSDIPVALLNEL